MILINKQSIDTEIKTTKGSWMIWISYGTIYQHVK